MGFVTMNCVTAAATLNGARRKEEKDVFER
jgi:hypothetical protein